MKPKKEKKDKIAYTLHLTQREAEALYGALWGVSWTHGEGKAARDVAMAINKVLKMERWLVTQTVLIDPTKERDDP